VQKSHLALAACAVIALASAANADEPSAPDAAALFKQLDANSNGQLATDEIPDDRKSLFERLLRKGDKNSDGQLSADEFAAALAGGRDPGDAPVKPTSDKTDKPDKAKKPDKSKKPGKAKKPDAAGDPARLFKRMDRNADGKVTADEVPEERRPMLERLIKRGDKDSDGAISLEEFTAAVERRNKSGAKPNKPQTPARTAAFGAMPPGLFAALDADGDGALSASEIEAAPEALRKLDADGDGTVSPREVMAAAGGKKKP
jgi:Ca2+-binding EF-hand superfamily protein